MAFKARGKREKREQDMGLCNCIVAIFQVMIACQSITFISGQGYLYSDTEFQSQKLLRDVSLFPRQQPHGVTSESHDIKLHPITHSTSQIRIIRFEPPFLDFDAECVGMPKLRTVYIHNPSKVRDLQLTSISARTCHFHASFFDKKIVPPGGNTSFEVVFLARIVGNVENTLFINTVHGMFPYQVFGVGIPNPYRLRPYLGARVPINSSFSPLISMHNPTSEPLQVTEMYSSSGFLQLQLPQGQHEIDKDQWEIPPYETKQLIRARFLGHVEANHTAFIRIKTAHMENLNSDHILPMEVEVSSAPGIYSSIELLDFGTLRQQYDDPKTLPLFLLNSGDHEVLISNITVTGSNPAISIQFKPIKLKKSDAVFTLVANITFSALLARSDADHRGTLTVKTKEKSYSTVHIPFTANLLNGTLGFDEDAVLFHHDENKTTRNISFSNLFQFPVLIQNVSVTERASKHFKVLNFDGPVSLPMSSEVTPFSIEYDPGEKKEISKEEKNENEFGSTYYLMLQTNASKFSLPLHTYSGLLTYKVLREEKKTIDFGVMGTMDKRVILFALYNHNPAKILLEKINSTLRNIYIRLESITQDSGKNISDQSVLKPLWLPSNSCSVFEVLLSADDKEEEITGQLSLTTKFETIYIPVKARIVVGNLTVKPERIKFPPSFPGMIVHQTLSVVNTFAQVTKLEYVHSKQMDKRFYYKKLKNQGLSFEPNKKSKIGKVYFDARQSCKPDRCYVGLPTSTTIGHHWLTTLALGPDSVEFDSKRYKEYRQRWKNLQKKGLTGPNTTLVLSADVVMDVEVPVQASLFWPTLLEEETFDFPLTHVGRKSVATLTLVNPADSPVIVQVLPLSLYPQPEAALAAFDWSDKIKEDSFIMDNSTLFHLMDPRQDVSKDMTSQMVWLEYTLNGKLNHTVVNLFIEPGDRVNLKVEFIPYDDNPKSTVILLRNNLTILDALPMHGRGAYEHLTLGGKSPNLQTSTLRFKLTKDLLKDCTKKKSNPSFTVRKWFHANNTGMLPIHVTSITVSGSPCEGYGFRVLDCDQFILQPNTSKKIEIAYTPDFTSYLVLHKLKLVTAQGNDMIFILNVTLPPYMLPLCQEAVPRPSWEPTLYYFIVTVMLVLCLGIMLMGYLEAINIWEPFVHLYAHELQHKLGRKKISSATSNITPEGFGKIFDLRSIANNFMSTVYPSTPKTEHISSPEVLDAKKSTSTSSTPSFKSIGIGIEPKQDVSQQTDPHPDFPPLSNSKNQNIPWYSRHLFSRFLSSFTYNKPTPKVPEKVIHPTVSSSKPVEFNQSGVRPRHISTMNDKCRIDSNGMKKFRPPENLSTVERRTKPTAEIRPVTKQVPEPQKQKISNAVITQKPNLAEKVNENSHKNVPKGVALQNNPSEKKIVNEVVVTRADAKKNALETRRSRSLSSQKLRESTSSSGSLEIPEAEPKLTKEASIDEATEMKKEAAVKTEHKPIRAKKTRKLTRKQAKALAKEKEKEAAAKFEKASTPSDTEEKIPVVTPPKKLSKKALRQLKQRSISTPIENVKETEKILESPSEAITEIKTPERKSPEIKVSSSSKEAVKGVPKRRSYSYNSAIAEQKNKPTKVTIFKRPSPLESSRSSSSQEISESSSGESTALWDTPSQQRDVDEDMRQIAKQSEEAGFMMDDKKRGKDRKRNKGTTSPGHLSSSSRSSSYSSVLSTASSNEGNTSKQQTSGPASHSTPTKKLSRSVSESYGNTKPQLRKRSPYPPVGMDPPNISPTHSSKKDPSLARTSPQSQLPYNPPARTLSSPSMFTNLFGTKAQQKQGPGAQDAANLQWSYQSPTNTSSYSAFGTSQFNLVENLMVNAPTHQNLPQQTWVSPFGNNTSLYSTPAPQVSRDNNISPPTSLSVRHRQWSNSGSPHQSTQQAYSTYDAPPGTPTTPGLNTRPGDIWGDILSPTTNTNMTTHSIWSVSNAVTMDENRNTDECDPLGVRSIWSNAHQLQNREWHDMR
ncbi:transmembrane protein 131-like [Styela clava]